jgi:hypothetical protein
MSSWKLCANALHARPGHSGTTTHCELLGIAAVHKALQRLKAFGFVESNGGRGALAVWTLTPLGVAWCENRVDVMRGTCLTERRLFERSRCRKRPAQLIAHPHRRHRIVATWLSALPVGIRIAHTAAEVAA